MYTKIQGAEFLDAFFSERQIAIDSMKKYNLEHLNGSSANVLSNMPIRAFPAMLVKMRIDELVILFISEKMPYVQMVPYLEFIVSRFEATRKIYDRYNLNLQRLSNSNECSFATYSKFSFLLSEVARVHDQKKYVFLNCLLKINDFLIFHLPFMNYAKQGEALHFLYKSLMNEKKILCDKLVENESSLVGA